MITLNNCIHKKFDPQNTFSQIITNQPSVTHNLNKVANKDCGN